LLRRLGCHGRRGQEGRSDRPHHPRVEAHRYCPGRHTSNEEGLLRPCRPSQDGGHL
jgi:hypothetical protein